MGTVEAYGEKELEAIKEFLGKAMIGDPLSFLRYEFVQEFGIVYPLQIEGLLNDIKSNLHLIAIPIATLREWYEDPNKIAVLPQTPGKIYPYGLLVETAFPVSFSDILQKYDSTIEKNKAGLRLSGFILDRPDDPNYNFMNFFRKP